MSYGTAFAAPLPTPGVTASPTFESQLLAWCQEAEGKLEQKIGQADLAVTTGDLATHGTRTIELPAAGATGVTATYDAANGYWSAVGAGNTVTTPLAVQPGQRITGVACHGRNGGVAWSLTVYKIEKLTGTVTPIGTVNSGAVAGTIEKKSIPPLTEVVLADYGYFARWTAGGAGDRFLGAQLQVDRI
jgi:hypothetical protein